MATRSLNQVSLIGNLTRDPELRYTPSGMAVCSFGLATNRSWTTRDGERKEDVQFHKIVAWNRLAELCSQLLKKGRRIFAGGRVQYREWVGSDNVKRQSTEIVIDDMIILDNKRNREEEEVEVDKEGEETYEFMDDISDEIGEVEPVNSAGGKGGKKSKDDEAKEEGKTTADEGGAAASDAGVAAGDDSTSSADDKVAPADDSGATADEAAGDDSASSADDKKAKKKDDEEEIPF